jgi:2-keto-3-deoxy-L-rhamnonate aldolase RhmA
MALPQEPVAAMLAASGLGPRLVERARTSTVVGTFVIELPCVTTIRAMALAGFGFVVIDMEHSTIGFEAVEPLVGAAQGMGLAALVRVWGEDVGLIGKALEAGANGLLVPHVGSAERATEIVRQTRFQPLGERSFSPLTRYDAVGRSKPAISAHTVVIVQIEGLDGLAAADAIAATPGIDGIFVGPHDLSGALNVAVDDPLLVRTASDLARRIPAAAVKGVYLDRPEDSAMWGELGFTLQCVGFDGRMLADAAAAVMAGTSVRTEGAA